MHRTIISGSSIALFLLVSVFINTISAQTTTFYSTLKLGSTGEEVFMLQKILNSDAATVVSESGAGSSGNESNYFGEKTHNAVIRFQEKYAAEILVPAGLSAGTGIVGANTRAVLNQLSAGVSPTVVNSVTPSATLPAVIKYPTISSVTPGSVSNPKNVPVTIVGENFLPQNSVFLSVQDIEIIPAPSYDGTTISVILNSVFIDRMWELIHSIPAGEQRDIAVAALKSEFNSTGKDGVYVPASVFVRNQNGESNKFEVLLNILRDVDTK